VRAIARMLGRSPSSISEELRNNSRACSPTLQILRDAVLTVARRLQSIILKSLNRPHNFIIRQHGVPASEAS